MSKDDPKPSTAPKKKTAQTRVELGTGPEVPAAVQEALGGAPIAPPSMAARAVRPGVPGVNKGIERVANPLFDEPTPEEAKAAKELAQLRKLFGQVISQANTASSIGRTLLIDPDDAMQVAADRLGFDLKAAAKVAEEFGDLVDKHKPQKAPKK